MPQFIPSLLPNLDSAIDGARWRHRLALFRLLRKSVTTLRPARFSTTADSPAKFCSRTHRAAILSLLASSGCAGWKLQTRTLITGAFTFTERRRRKRSAGRPATVVFE